jgi:hypothetical protein
MQKLFFRAISAVFLTTATAALLVGCSSMNEATQSAYLVEPTNGAVVSSPFKVRFGVRGMAVAPAGDVLVNSGHHHLLINLDSIAAGESIPFSERHLHFGKGQTETEVTLPPGSYKITAQFANGAHQSYGKVMSQTISVTVK